MTQHKDLLIKVRDAMKGVEKLFRANGFCMQGTATTPYMEALAALQAAIDAPEPEPVAVVDSGLVGGIGWTEQGNDLVDGQELYTPHRSSTKTLISSMHILARDIESQDGVANEAIREAAERLELLQNLLRDCLPYAQAWHGAEHMLDEFNARPRPAIDSLLKRVTTEADITP